MAVCLVVIEQNFNSFDEAPRAGTVDSFVAIDLQVPSLDEFLRTTHISQVAMTALCKAFLRFILLAALSTSTIAQAADNAVQASQSAGSAASSAASAASSADAAKKSADAIAAKFDLPINIAVGDRMKLRSNVTGLKPVNGGTGEKAPRFTCMRVVRLGADGGLTVAVEDGKGFLSGTCGDPSGDGSVVVGDSYTITAEQLKNASYSRYGWIYGPMVVPFKYFPHDRSFEPSQSLGMYAGYRTSWFESRGLSIVGSAGLATIKVSQVVDDPNNAGIKTTKENTIAGYTLAFGALFDLTREVKPFVAGLLIGRDFVGRNSALTYVHDNRTWIALQVGWVL